MLKSLKVGMGFGLTSATITTLGLLIGLESSTGSKLAVIGGILTIAIADSCSDALGVHVAKESEGNFTNKEVWQATISALVFKMIFALTFLIPVFIFSAKNLHLAAYTGIIWGFIILVSQSFMLAKDEKISPMKVIREHLTIATVVMLGVFFLGKWIAVVFQ